MKYLIVFILIFNALYANDSQSSACCRDSGFNVNYQNKLDSLDEKISDTNSNNKLLEQKLADTEKYYVSMLRNQEILAENQKNELKTILEQQEKNHQNTIDNLFYLFHMIVATVISAIGAAGYFGIKKFKKIVDKAVLSEHNRVTSRLVNEFADSREFIAIVRAEMDLYFSRDEDEDEREDEREDANNNEMLS